MKAKASVILVLSLFLSSCGFLSNDGPTHDYVVNGAVGTVAGAGIGAAIGSAISNGDVANSALLGGGVGLAVGVVGTYAYKKIAAHNELIDNDDLIESNRAEILNQQAEVDQLRAEAIADSRGVEINQSKTGKVYDGVTLGVYYR